MPTDYKILNGSGLTTLVSLIKRDIDAVTSTISSPIYYIDVEYNGEDPGDEYSVEGTYVNQSDSFSSLVTRYNNGEDLVVRVGNYVIPLSEVRTSPRTSIISDLYFRCHETANDNVQISTITVSISTSHLIISRYVTSYSLTPWIIELEEAESQSSLDEGVVRLSNVDQTISIGSIYTALQDRAIILDYEGVKFYYNQQRDDSFTGMTFECLPTEVGSYIIYPEGQSNAWLFEKSQASLTDTDLQNIQDGIDGAYEYADQQIAAAMTTVVTPTQSDWTQATTTSLDYIKNKPVLPENNILSYQGKNSSMSGGDNYYYMLATDITDGTTTIYQVPAYTTTPENSNQVITKGYLDGQIDAVTATIPSITVTQGLTTGIPAATITIGNTSTIIYSNYNDRVYQQPLSHLDGSLPIALAYGQTTTDTIKYSQDIRIQQSNGSSSSRSAINILENGDYHKIATLSYNSLVLSDDNPSTYNIATIHPTTLTNLRDYTLPDASGTLALQSYVDNAITTAIGGITGVEFNTSYTTYSSLPTTGAPGTIYLIPNNGTTPNIYDEYIYASNTYEKIGTTEVDLSDYVTTTDMSTALTPYAQSTALTPYVIEYNGTVNAAEAYAAYEAGRPIVLRNHGYEVSEGDLALTAIQKTGSSNYYFTFEKSGTNQQQYYSYDTSSGWHKDIVNFVRSTQVTPTSGVTGTAIATIAGKTIYAPVNEEGITTETDPVYSASPAAGITTGDITRWNNSAPTTVATTTTNGLMSSSDKIKLNGIAAGAEVNVQSDWAVTTTTSDAFIKNKPTITYDSTNTSLVFSGF